MKYFIVTYGCQMNKSDSERIAGFLNDLGMREVSGPDEADLVLLNTCSVRQSAEDRVFGKAHNLFQLKKTNPNLVVAVTGCLPGRDKDSKLRAKMHGIDLFFPIVDLVKLPEMLAQLGWVLGNKKDAPDDYLSIAPAYKNNFQAFVPIQTGCDNFCAYCVVPYSRGREFNRPLKEILAEVKKLAERGCLEITLLGQTVNSYQAPDAEEFSNRNPFVEKRSFGSGPVIRPFAQDDASRHIAALLWELNQVPGIERIHFTAADPQYMTDEVIKALILPKQINYFHLPAQSGSNSVLARMNRKYTGEKYLEIISKVKKARPEIALGTDIIVGFPGESERDFNQTTDLYKQADFDISYTAKYSPRSGTAAFRMKDDVPAEEKERRWRVLQELMEKNTLRKNQTYLGKTISVLVEKCANGICSGNSGEMKLVQFAGGPKLVGKLMKVKITQPEMWVLRGELNLS
ncbi:MAG: MiaB/RimO family radical SAM methylthiotransferase [Candidatus Magasanikbacteria bacterium]|nr:MiaB/RimO family radical SAM methylthiotransferase [Candidatus Magasanikbacteria bacterium]